MSNPEKTCEPGWIKAEDEKSCNRTETETETCSLEADGSSPPCYGSDGSWISTTGPAPAQDELSASYSTPLVLSESCSQLLFLGGVDGAEPELIQKIKASQEKEQRLLDILQSHSMSTGSVTGTEGGEQSLEELKIENVSTTRKVLLEQLSNIYTSTQCGLSSDRVALRDQIAMIQLAEEHLKNIRNNMSSLRASRANKQRMVEISNYEYDRYASHTDIFRTVATCSLFILGGIWLNSLGRTTIGNIVIILTAAILVFLVAKKIWLNWWRDPMNWNEFEWYNDPGSKPYETIGQHDRGAVDGAMAEGLIGTGQPHKYHTTSRQFAPYN